MKLRILTLVLLLCSCTKDSFEDCEPKDNVHITVKTDYDLRSTSAASAEWYSIDEVSIFVVDANNNLVTSWEGGAYTADEDYRATFSLQEGFYRFVVWTNLGDTYTVSSPLGDVKSGLFIDDIMINMAIPPDGKIRESIPHRHYGSITNTKIFRNRDNNYVVTIKPHTYKLNFKIKGLSPLFHQYDIMVTDNNWSHRLDNSCVSGKECYHHIRSTEYQPRSRAVQLDPFTNELTDSMILLQMDDDTETTFSIVNSLTEEIIYSVDLIQTITQAFTNAGELLDFSRIFEFDIVFTFDTHMFVTVSVNGWDYTEQDQKL